ncbi:MAG TPA: class F sortase [Bacillota bacterium]|nr:class F sortase [Bacillota bacterium]
MAAASSEHSRERLRRSGTSGSAQRTPGRSMDIIRRPVAYRRPYATQPISRASFVLRLAPAANEQAPTVSDPVRPRRAWKAWAVAGMAAVIFGIGLFVSVQGWKTNHQAVAAVTHLAQSVATQTASADTATVPSTAQPSTNDLSSYNVAPDKPRYITIDKIGVHARVLSLGLTADGALAVPGNVFDAGWYNRSSLPGQPGAMVIDGHVSSWTTNGVFYDLKKLAAGDTLSIERGDGQKFTYKVVRTVLYDAESVDMQALTQAITAGKPGLNLITCAGKVKPGTSEFTQRLAVFTEQLQ